MLVLLVSAVAGVVYLRRTDAPVKAGGGTGAPGPVGRPADSGPSPTSYSSAPSTAVYQGIGTRTADGEPLTEKELFAGAAAKMAVPDAGLRLTLRAKRLDGDCAAAVWGSGVGDELRRGGCVQAGRLLYLDATRKYALSVTVFNLNGAEDADRVVEALGGGRGGGFVAPLPGPAPLDRFGTGFGMARGLAMGHYAVVAWAQRLNGKGDESDERLLSLLIQGGQVPAVLARAAVARP